MYHHDNYAQSLQLYPIAKIQHFFKSPIYFLEKSSELIIIDFNFQEKTGVLLSAGVDFGKNSDEFLRLNIACPRQLLEKGLKAIKKGVAIYKQI